MKRMALVAGALVAAGLGGCMSDGDTMETSAVQGGAAASANAELLDAAGKRVGTAVATQVGGDVRIRLESTAMPAGTHAAHVHMVGTCTPPSFESAGEHWNPTGRQHGRDNPAGMHKGDLPNIDIAADGRGSIEYAVDDAAVTGGSAALLDTDGSAIIVHTNADDYRTDPTGNAGGRIACGVFR